VYGSHCISCASPFDATFLADYWLAQLDESDESAVDEHLLSCNDCGPRLREIIALAEGLRDVALRGSMHLIVSDRFLQRAQEKGLQGLQHAPPVGGSVQCTVSAEYDLLVGRLAADLSGVRRVDFALLDESGAEQSRLRDIPFLDRPGDVIFQVLIEAMKAASDLRLTALLIARDDADEELVLGEYLFDHKRSNPDR
jgi:hypothetical protein